eukprot:TRINITY_DN21430_c0_g3_i1.p1 TRINITY_DN21430_c0_g3~~TRINITY_DN21430_c0_g3_i1.p1  ORF type:complete len:2799 (-),score=680.31 TRINITY_DN21430_c0_g3_i1:45-8354(-)
MPGANDDGKEGAAQAAALEGEQERRAKLEKLLEVQTVQVDLQKELRMKTESLLQVEQQTTQKLRRQLEEMKKSGPNAAQEAVVRSKELEESFGEAKERIRILEQQLNESRAPETSDREESHLKKQLEEQETIIRNLRKQMEEHAGGMSVSPVVDREGEAVRLQVLVQSRDKQLDELSKAHQAVQNEAAAARYEADVLKHQASTLKAEVTERNAEIERQLQIERNLRAEIFSHMDKAEKLEMNLEGEVHKVTSLLDVDKKLEEEMRRVQELEKILAQERETSREHYDKLKTESEATILLKEQTIKHQTTAIEALNLELKEKKVEVTKLVNILGTDDPAHPDPRLALRNLEGGGLLPPMPTDPKPMDDTQVQRSLESMHKQLKAKDSKINKQSERLQALTEMLEQRDAQLSEMSTARRDREQMRQRLKDMEEAMGSQTKVVSHAESERRLINQEIKLKEHEREVQDLQESYQKERQEKETLSRELAGLRGTLAQGASSAGALEAENAKLSKDLADHRVKLEAKNEELKKLRDVAAESQATVAKVRERQMPEPSEVASLPAVQRRLQKLEDTDKTLARDVLVYLQEREGKIENLSSTITLLRKTVDELQAQKGMAKPTPPAGVNVAVGDSRDTTPVAVGVETDAGASGVPAAVGRDSPMRRSGEATPQADVDVGLISQALAGHVVATEQSKAEQDALKAEQDARKAEQDARKAEQDARKAEQDALAEAARWKAEQAETAAALQQAQQKLAEVTAQARSTPPEAAAYPPAPAPRPPGQSVATNTSLPQSPAGSRPGSSRKDDKLAAQGPPQSPRGPLPPLRPRSRGEEHGFAGSRTLPLGTDALRQTGGATANASGPASTTWGHDSQLAAEDLKTMSADQIRQELMGQRSSNQQLESQLEEKRQLVMKLIEETNLCNAEVASLKQTLQQAFKGAKKQEREYEELAEQKAELEQTNKNLEALLTEEKEKYTKLFREHQQDVSGNEAVDSVDREVTSKLKVLTPRQHEIRNSVFLVINRRSTDEVLDKTILAVALAQQFAINVSRISVVEDARLSDNGAGDEFVPAGSQMLDLPLATPPATAGSAREGGAMAVTEESAQDVPMEESMLTDGAAPPSRDLVLVNIADSELSKAGEMVKCTVSALDVLEQVRGDMLSGHRIGPLDGLAVDAVFINHGDIILPFEWPSQQARLLLREGRVLAGKYAVVTIHEVRDPYVLRVVAYDTEAGHEFVVHLYAKDVALLLDTRDSEAVSGEFRHLEGPLVSHFRNNFTVCDQASLDVIVGSLSFSVFQNQQILVASEMRIPLQVQRSSEIVGQDQGAEQVATQTAAALQLATVPASSELVQVRPPKTLPDLAPGATRGLRPVQRQVTCLCEEVICFEGRPCVFSLLHNTSADLEEDLLRAVVYYPKTCAQLEVNIWQPMLSDRLRIVAEAGELDAQEAFNVAAVVEEVVYPPSFVIRLTSVSVKDAFKVSPQEGSKPHTHIIRVSKDGGSALHVPDLSFALTPSTIRAKMLHCIGLSTPMHGPRETLLTMPSQAAAAAKLVGRIVTGHVNDPAGLRIQLVPGARGGDFGDHGQTGAAAAPLTSASAAGQPAAVRAQLRTKYGKGKQLARAGVCLQLRGGQDGESVRCIVTVSERPEPYQHFIVHAYEPQTSREWEVLADSIDVFKLFTGNTEGRSPALDLTNPAARKECADILLRSGELQQQDDELVLTISAAAARKYMMERQQLQRAASAKDRDNRAPEVAGREEPVASEGEGQHLSTETFDVQTISSHTRMRAKEGESEVLVELRGRDRIFVGQRRLPVEPDGVESELYKVQIFDAQMNTFLHSYLVVASKLDASSLAAAGLPVAQQADPESGPEVQRTDSESTRSFSLKVTDKVLLEDAKAEPGLLDPSRQEELLNWINESLCLVRDGPHMDSPLRLRVRQQRRRRDAAQLDHASKVPASHGTGDMHRYLDSLQSREIGGSWPLRRLEVAKDAKNSRPKQGADKLKGPSLLEQAAEHMKFLARDWQKLHSIEQHWGGSTVVITVSRLGKTFKVGVYEPKSKSNYEMCLATANCSTPMSILIERVELTVKLDLLLCIYEVAFPHQVSIVVEHIQSSLEFKLNIGDDDVYTMIENSRKDAFTMFMDQLIHCGCVGGEGGEGQALATDFDETYAGNQMFEKTVFDDEFEGGNLTEGDLRPVALAPEEQKRQRVPVIRTQLDFASASKKSGRDTAEKAQMAGGLTTTLIYHAEYSFPRERESLIFRVHKRMGSGDVAFTLRMRGIEGLSAPAEPENSDMRGPRSQVGPGLNRHSGDTPFLTSGEAVHSKEVTIWLPEKCSYYPCGCYGEIVEVPGLSKQVAILITDEDSPRMMRVAVVLAQLPFTVLFQAVLLENAETFNTQLTSDLKPMAGRKVLKDFFEKTFMPKGGGSSGVLSHLEKQAEAQRQGDLRNKIDEMDKADGGMDGLGIELGEGTGGPISASRPADTEEGLAVSILYMCTKRKMGRMMVFTVFRDLIAHHMYLRVVMHDPETQKDFHMTMLHYTTQKLLSVLRINRDMLEEASSYHDDEEKKERHKLRTELGKIIVDHLYLRKRLEGPGDEEIMDDVELMEGEDVEYQLRMRDIMDSSNTSSLSSKLALLDEAREGAEHDSLDDIDAMLVLEAEESVDHGSTAISGPMPKTLHDISEEHLLFKAEQEVGGRRVLVTIYNETTKEDNLHYSHNIRIAVSDIQTLTVLAVADFHEDTLEPVTARRNKRHLMSACRESELAQDLFDCLVLQRKGQQVTGINLQGEDV